MKNIIHKVIIFLTISIIVGFGTYAFAGDSSFEKADLSLTIGSVRDNLSESELLALEKEENKGLGPHVYKPRYKKTGSLVTIGSVRDNLSESELLALEREEED